MFGENNDLPQNGEQAKGHPVFDAISSILPMQEADKGANENNEQLSEEEKAKKFSETLFAISSDTQDNDDPVQAKILELQAQGYKIERVEESKENVEISEKIRVAQENIDKAKEFVALNDKTIVLNKVKNDLAEYYQSVGKKDLINSEEFNIEAEAEFEAKYGQPAVLEIYANNIRQTIKQNVIDKNENEINTNKATLSSLKEQEFAENKKSLETKLSEIFESGYGNLKFKEEQINKAYNKIISGSFANEMKNNPGLLGELALLYYNKEEIIKSIGQPSYGQGVKDVIDKTDNRNPSSAEAAAQKRTLQEQDKGYDVSSWLKTNPVDTQGKAVF